MTNPFFISRKNRNYDSPESYEAMYGKKMSFGQKAYDNVSDGAANMSMGDYAQGIGAGLSAGAANSQPVGDFTVDQYAGFRGSGQGLMSGGVIGAIVGGVGAQVGQFRNINKNLEKVDTSIEGVTFDAYGRPVYSGGNVNAAFGTMGELNKGLDKLNKTHIDPATNLFSSGFGTRRKIKRKRAQLAQGITQAQQSFNEADLNYRNQMLAEQSYRDRLNNDGRMYSLYRAQYGY